TRISRNLQRAVIVSEDGRFCQHWGIDPREILAAIKRARNGVPRGASTITMQVAKNLFLWSSKSYVRKLLELPLTLALEVIWSKERILEVYLNIAEWGPGVFGAEAAARHHFGKSAARLSQNEAALLAVALPNPIRRDAGEPGRGTSRLASIIVARMRSAGPVTSCIARSR
ncbi:MAG: monofunctional biosynthetic peptidoglycan transglycosylase, partial [Hyphomicrobiaceae bacterium]|nr:monofunctional biosynthetic peptidoglycan transglycosylase [Hyphomicrobiaceae bacterium]